MSFLKKYFKGVYVGLFLMLAPGALCLILWLLREALPSDPNKISLLDSFSFGLFLLALPLAILGFLILLVSGAVYLVKHLRVKENHTSKTKLCLAVLGTTCLLYLLYIPGGPDECSRVITGNQYTNCLKKVFKNYSEGEIKTWFKDNGYVVGRDYLVGGWITDSERKKVHIKEQGHDYRFEVRRSYRRPSSTPYGFNISRWVMPMFPAPNVFKMRVEALNEGTIIHDIEVDWSFSFL